MSDRRVLVDVVGRTEVFRRDRKPLEVEVFAPPMLCSFILKGVGKAIGSISYVSVHRAFTAMML
jgi:pantothenate kinase